MMFFYISIENIFFLSKKICLMY